MGWDIKKRILGTLQGKESKEDRALVKARQYLKNKNYFWARSGVPEDLYFQMYGNEPTDKELDNAYNEDEDFQSMVDYEFDDWAHTKGSKRKRR